MRNPRLLAASLAALSLAGCGSDTSSRREVPQGFDASSVCPLLESSSLKGMGLEVRWHSEVKESHGVRLFLGKRHCYVETAESTVHALDRRDGYYRWIQALKGPLQTPPGEGPSSAYFASGNSLEAVDLSTGRRLWQENLPFRPITPPAANDGFLGMGAANGSVYVLRLRQSDATVPGGIRQTHDVLWHWSVGNPLQAVPVLPPDSSAQILAVGGDGLLECRSLPDGKARWRYPYRGAMGPVGGAMVYDFLPLAEKERPQRALFVGSMDHHLLALDPEGGTLLASYLATDAIEARPLVLSHVRSGNIPDWSVIREIYCLSQDGRLASLRVEDVHRARRDPSGAPLMDDRKRLQWVPEGEDADDVSGGDVEEASLVPAEGDGSEPGEIRRPQRHPVHWSFRCLWTADGVARVISRGRSGVYVEGFDGRLKLLDETGRERWSRSLQGVRTLTANEANPFRAGAEAPSLFLMDDGGVVWCLQETD